MSHTLITHTPLTPTVQCLGVPVGSAWVRPWGLRTLPVPTGGHAQPKRKGVGAGGFEGGIAIKSK